MSVKVVLKAMCGFLFTLCLSTDITLAVEEHSALTVRPVPFVWIPLAPYHPCGLLIGLEEERYDKKASVMLSSAKPESSEGVAFQVIKAMRAKKSDFLRSILLNPNAKELEGLDLDKWLKFFDMPEDPTLLRIYRLGEASLYIFKSDRPEPPILQVLITPSQGKFFFDMAGQQTPLCELAVVLNQAIANDAATFGRVASLDGYQSIELPSIFGDKDRKHPAKLYFKGLQYIAKVFPLDANAIEQLPTTNNPRLDGAVKFYAQLWSKLAAGDVNAFVAANYAPRGNIEFFRKTDKTQLGEMFHVAGTSRSSRQINYILYSDNVFWMVNQPFTGPYQQKNLIYHMIIWDDASKSYKLVRAFPYLDALTSFTQWKEFAREFIDKVINVDKATRPADGDDGLGRNGVKSNHE